MTTGTILREAPAPSRGKTLTPDRGELDLAPLRTGAPAEPPPRGTAASPTIVAILDELFGPAQGTRAWSLQVRDALAVGHLREAIELCDGELLARPRTALALFLRGVARHESGQYGLAIADFTRAIAINIHYAHLVETLGGR